MFRLTNQETNELIIKGVSQSVIPPGYNTGGAEMFAFTEHGVAMLVMQYDCPGIGSVKLLVGIRHKTLLKVQYCITALEVE